MLRISEIKRRISEGKRSLNVWMIVLSLNVLTGVYANDVPPKTKRFHKENVLLKRHIAEVKCDEIVVKSFEEKIKKDNKLQSEKIVEADKKGLKRAESDLVKDETNLLKDKKELEKEYDKIIDKCEKKIKKDREELRTSKKLLTRAIHNENEVAIKLNAAIIAKDQKKLRRDKEALTNERSNKKSDIAMIGDEIKKSKEELKEARSTEAVYSYKKTNGNVRDWFKRSKKG